MCYAPWAYGPGHLVTIPFANISIAATPHGHAVLSILSLKGGCFATPSRRANPQNLKRSAAQVIADEGVNYQQAMHATCSDIDATAVHMAYVQLSLLHIPAIIIHGNALSMEQRGYWLTPAHALGFWDSRLKLDKTAEQDNDGQENDDHPVPLMPDTVFQQVREIAVVQKDAGQLTLF